ncbi:MAG: hypothetical protein ABR953_04915 [Candidatus Acidiferrales bacterium]|jgi:hypothetical protein
MKAHPTRTRFSFDFTHSSHVTWTYDRHRATLETGTPATFSVDDQEIATRFSSAVEPVMADLVDVAVAIHMADRLAIRALEGPANWSRELHLRLAVRHPEKWNSPTFQERFTSLVNFLTEDSWSLEFSFIRDNRRTSETQPYLFPKASDGIPFWVSLFSGGLDSLAGTATSVFSSPNNQFILVSAAPNIRQRSRQQQQIEILRRKSGASILHVSIPYAMKYGDQYAQEASRRTRGFLFLIFGGVVSLAAGSARLHVYENGLGAINLPYDQSQIGTDNARAVHPRVLGLAAELLASVSGKPFSIINPCIYLTKAQMLAHHSIRQIQEALALTFSCDGFPVRAEGKSQCGFCTSCLLRRLSLEIAGLDAFDTHEYLRDWKSQSFPSTHQHLRGLRAMDWQTLRFRRCLEESDPWLALTLEFPELRVLVRDLSRLNHEPCAEIASKLQGLIERHVHDWPRFSALPLLNATDTKVA